MRLIMFIAQFIGQVLGSLFLKRAYFGALAYCGNCIIFLFSSLISNISISVLLYISALACIGRWAVMGYIEDFWLIFLLQLMHSLTYAVCHYAIVRYITTQPQSHIAKLQGLYNGLSNGVLIAISPRLQV